MVRPGTFERVYAAIRQQLREGAFRPGERVEPAALADELNASVTPVRDALHRLTGERLVEAPKHDGFRVPMLTETTLRHLYAWHLDLLLLAVMKRGIAAAGSADGEIPDARQYERQNALFLSVVQSAGNPEHLLALKALTERLEPVQRLEERFLDETETETKEIVRALGTHDWKAVRRNLIRYHRRRERIVPELLAMLLQP